jgi:hypothetical protein
VFDTSAGAEIHLEESRLSENDSPSKPFRFVGMIHGVEPGSLTIAVLNPESETISSDSFRLEPIPLARYLQNQNGNLDFKWTEDLGPVHQFLSRHIPTDREIRVLVEAPTVLPFEDGTPAAVFPDTSSLFRVLCFICMDGYGLQAAHYEVPEQQRLVAHFVSASPDDPSSAVLNQPRFLKNGTASAYCELLFGITPNPRQAAAVAALIAKNHGSYYYWTTTADAPSSGDIVQHLRIKQSKMLVVCGLSTVSMQIRTVEEDIEDVALEYAIAQQRWAHLGSNDATKAALIYVSRKFNFDIRCYSTRVDAKERDPRMVFPLSPEDHWIAESIRSLGIG